MPTITLEHETLTKIQKNNGVVHDYIKWENWLPKLGCPVENNDEEKIEIEVFPDRPDLLSHETMAKAIRSFLKLSKESPDLEILPGENKIQLIPKLYYLKKGRYQEINLHELFLTVSLLAIDL